MVAVPPEYRFLLCGSATAAWYASIGDERDAILGRLVATCRTWATMEGVRFLGSLDDDLYMAGDPSSHGRWSTFLLFAADSPERGVVLVDELRRGDPRLDRYFTFVLTVGRAYWPMEDPGGD